MFEKGDIVECIDDSNLLPEFPKIKAGNKYVVDGVMPCCKRGVDIGLRMPESKSRYCSYCGHITFNDIPHYKNERFRKIGTLYRTVEIASEIKSLPIVSETSDNLKMKG